jgi:hypothetical protein
LPAVTVADRAALALVVLAGLFAGALLARHGASNLAVLPPLAGGLLAGLTALRWTRSSRRAGRWTLQYRTDAGLCVAVAGRGAWPAQLGPRTRVLGPSVFLDLRFAAGGPSGAYRRWLTPLDVPAPVLRRWTVVLPWAGRVASS